jgi:hypothetical protein
MLSVRLLGKMLLNHWTHERKQVEFDPETGQAKTIVLSNAKNTDKPCSGFAHSEKRIFGSKVNFAIYREDENIIFSAGEKNWLTENSEIEFKHSQPFPFISKFQIIEKGVCTFSILYSHLARSLYSIVDVTYDQIDRDADFYLEFITENILDKEWRAMVTKKWE